MVAGLGSRVFAADTDVRDHGRLAAAVDEAARSLGRLDIVVAAAAILSSAPAHQLAEESWEDLIDASTRSSG
jgi:(+)-trans-carveol dehydrogenase